MKTVAFCTLGCKVNQYETNAMMQKMIEAGYEVVDFETKADIYIINTCTVTNMADKKSRQMLRRVKEINPEAILVAVGCYAQVAKEKLEQIPEIDLIVGINEKNDIVKYVEQASKNTYVSDVLHQTEFLDFGDVTYTEKTRAVIKVQDGCNQFCSYCIIPYARGRIRSRKPESVIKEITDVAKEGIKEVTRLAKEKHIPIRIGVNAGSIDKNINNTTDIVQAKELVESAKKMAKILEDEGFYDIVISLKCSHVLQTISAYELASKEFDYPLHIGITEAGPKDVGLIRSVAGIAPLLLKGIGDTIRISLSDEPEEEIKACKRLLKDLELNNDYPLLISCPTCGRTQVDLVHLANKVLQFLEDNKINKTVAIMGCIVNGPGEAKRADIGCAGGKGVWAIFKKDTVIKTVSDEEIFEELTKEIKKL